MDWPVVSAWWLHFKRFGWERCVVDRSFAMITTLLMPLPVQREQRGGVQSTWGLAAMVPRAHVLYIIDALSYARTRLTWGVANEGKGDPALASALREVRLLTMRIEHGGRGSCCAESERSFRCLRSP